MFVDSAQPLLCTCFFRVFTILTLPANLHRFLISDHFRFNALWLVYLHLFKSIISYNNITLVYSFFLFAPTFFFRKSIKT